VKKVSRRTYKCNRDPHVTDSDSAEEREAWLVRWWIRDKVHHASQSAVQQKKVSWIRETTISLW